MQARTSNEKEGQTYSKTQAVKDRKWETVKRKEKKTDRQRYQTKNPKK